MSVWLGIKFLGLHFLSLRISYDRYFVKQAPKIECCHGDVLSDVSPHSSLLFHIYKQENLSFVM